MKKSAVFQKVILFAFIPVLLSSSNLFAQDEEIPSFVEIQTTLEFYTGEWMFDYPDEGNLRVEIYERDDKLYRKKENEPEYPRELMSPFGDGVKMVEWLLYMKREMKVDEETREYFTFMEEDAIYGNFMYYFSDFRNGRFHKCRVVVPGRDEIQGRRIVEKK